MTSTPSRRRSPARQTAMTERARLKAEAQKEAAAARQAEARVKELRLQAATATPPGAAPFLEAVRAARDPSQRVITDEPWIKLRLLELAEVAAVAGDMTATLRVMSELKALGTVPVFGSQDELDGRTIEGLQEMHAQLVQWVGRVETKIKEMQVQGAR